MIIDQILLPKSKAIKQVKKLTESTIQKEKQKICHLGNINEPHLSLNAINLVLKYLKLVLLQYFLRTKGS